MTRPQRNRGGGFSLIEVLVASVAASILAVAAGTMLVLAWHSWSALHQGIDMQRDAASALATLRSRLHAATEDDVSITDGVLWIQTAGPKVSFYQQGTDLVYDPDSDPAAEGDEINMVAGRLVSFAPSSTNQSGRVTVTIALSLTGDIGHETTDFSATVALRN